MTASVVRPTLWIGDWQDARTFIMENSSAYIITCAFDSPVTGHEKYDLVDGPAPDNDKLLFRAIDRLIVLQRSNVLTLVHCVSGISRSAAVVIGYLMRSSNMDYDDAYKLLKRIRPSINPVQYFVDALGGYYKPRGL